MRLYFSRHTYCPLMHRYSLNGASPVETQNVASPVHAIAIYSFNNMLDNNRIYPLVRARFCVSTIAVSAYHPYTPHHSLNGASPVETQNVASPVLPIAIHSFNNMLVNNRIYPLVRRKILRLYYCRQRISSLYSSSFTQWRKPSRDAKSCVSTFADSVGRMVFPDCHTIEYSTLFRKHHFHTA